MRKGIVLTVCAVAAACLTMGSVKKIQAEEMKLQVPSVCGALHVEANHLTDSQGNPVQLRGISTHGIAWYPQYINSDLFRQFRREWNVNVMRLAMYTAESGGYCTDGNKEEIKNLIRKGVACATENDMYVIVDWHILSDNHPQIYQEEAKSFFGEMAAEFAGQENVLYEICNEPNGNTSWQEIKEYAAEIIPVIRQQDPDAVILVGTPNWSQFVDQAAADPITEYENLMYVLHFYAATHKDDLRNTMTAAADEGLPIFVSEYGICDASGNGVIDENQAGQWIRLMNQYGISYAAWNLSNKDESSAILKSDCTKISDLTEEDLSESGRWLYRMLTESEGNAVQADDGDEKKSAGITQENQSGEDLFSVGNLYPVYGGI